MQTGKSTIKTIFEGTKIFNVPIYQRAYSWNADNLKDFLSDLINQYDGRKYFLGSFLFHSNGTRGEFAIIDIVDGQQRLTTFIVFMNALISQLSKEKSVLITSRTIRTFIKDEDVFKLELSNEDSSFLHNYIIGNRPTHEAAPKTPSQTLLIEAKAFFEAELAKLDINILEKIYLTATEADVLLYIVEEINAATQIFELLNDRGRKLTDLEAIKSFLMYNVGLLTKNPNQLIGNIQHDFGEIYRYIEQYEVNERDVLRYHTIAFEGSDEDPKKYIKKKIIELIKTGKSDVINTITEYSVRLKDSFRIFVDIQEAKSKDVELTKLFMIGRVAPFYPVMIRTKKERPDLFSKLIANINRFTFKASFVSLRSNGETPINNALRGADVEPVINLISGIVSDNWWNINNRVVEVLKYKNYYEWVNGNIVKYILFCYENSLRAKKGFPLLGYSEYFTDVEREKLSIEHITAQKAKGLVFDKEFSEQYLHSIGNLVIDCKASNSSKGNKNTESKIDAYNRAPLMSQNELNLIDCDWSDLHSVKRFIADRETNLMEFIKREFRLHGVPDSYSLA